MAIRPEPGIRHPQPDIPGCPRAACSSARPAGQPGANCSHGCGFVPLGRLIPTRAACQRELARRQLGRSEPRRRRERNAAQRGRCASGGKKAVPMRRGHESRALVDFASARRQLRSSVWPLQRGALLAGPSEATPAMSPATEPIKVVNVAIDSRTAYRLWWRFDAHGGEQWM